MSSILDKPCCAMCKRNDVPLSFEPSRKVLIMGPFPGGLIPHEYRCDECEKKFCQSIERMLDKNDE